LPARDPPRGARNRRFAATLALILLVAPGALAAAPAGAKRTELKGLQGRIQALQQELARTEETRADAAEELRETESAISAANRRLRELGGERAEARTALAALEQQSQTLGERIGRQQARLGRLLARQYRAGDGDALRHLLAGNDPNQIARDAYYLLLLSRAQAAMIGALKQDLHEKAHLAAQAQAKNAELAAIERHEQAGRNERLEQQKQRQSVLARIAGQIKAQRSEVEKLRRDERRLARLVEALGRIVARPKRADPRAQPPLRNDATPDASLPDDAFASRKGRLRLPARGELANRFGTPRQDGGTTWKGLFIRAAAGGEVKAVAAGRVVFADWLRGFGNLVVVDHGGGYLSVYGNNESILREVGQAVAGGDAIATVGDSGGNPETGLYFELRHLGHAIDPLKWVSLK